MFRSLPKRTVIGWLLSLLGPPAPPPRRHFSKHWDQRVRHPGAAGRGMAGYIVDPRRYPDRLLSVTAALEDAVRREE